ncbi:MAG TPA: phosphoglucosamine mutase [Acidimicrobiia bacterium]
MTLRFGTDGVRGVANRDLTPELVTALGRAAARVLGSTRAFLVGRDTRRSGPMLEAALVAGLCAEGAGVLRAGVLPTPGLAYLAQRRNAPAAMISASHNPFVDNGVKLFAPGGRKIPDDAERQVEAELRKLAVEVPTGAPEGAGVGFDRGIADGRRHYLDHLVRALEGRRLDGVGVVLDCGHGAAFEAAPLAFEELGARVDVRNARPDGTNINAGCGSTEPAGLQQAVVETGADLGLAFDGDADRVIGVDERGALVDGDQMLGALALDFRSRGRLRGDAVVATVMSNLGLRRALDDHGIALVETPVGDRHVLAALAARGLSLGGEQSGHVICADLATTGDGTLTGLLLADLVARRGAPLSQVAAVVTRLPQVLRNVRVADRAGLASADGFGAEVRAAERDLGREGRVLVRPSGTEPVVRVMVEAPTHDQAEAIADRLAAAAERACGTPNLD